MQFKALLTLASVAAVAVAAPQDAAAADSASTTFTLTTALTTNTFTASKVLQIFEQAEPWVTTLTTDTVWTVTHTVTKEKPTDAPAPSSSA
ncbi:hypothetical protein C8Q79DRAFT_995592 [Trametes meyenii]|nr:hypothetical protein C8Q79DRAFT_995592 [Trametes meyenii]